MPGTINTQQSHHPDDDEQNILLDFLRKYRRAFVLGAALLGAGYGVGHLQLPPTAIHEETKIKRDRERMQSWLDLLDNNHMNEEQRLTVIRSLIRESLRDVE